MVEWTKYIGVALKWEKNWRLHNLTGEKNWAFFEWVAKKEKHPYWG